MAFRTPVKSKNNENQDLKKYLSKSFSVAQQKFGQQKSSLDTHTYEPIEQNLAVTPEKSAAPFLLNAKKSTV